MANPLGDPLAPRILSSSRHSAAAYFAQRARSGGGGGFSATSALPILAQPRPADDSTAVPRRSSASKQARRKRPRVELERRSRSASKPSRPSSRGYIPGSRQERHVSLPSAWARPGSRGQQQLATQRQRSRDNAVRVAGTAEISRLLADVHDLVRPPEMRISAGLRDPRIDVSPTSFHESNAALPATNGFCWSSPEAETLALTPPAALQNYLGEALPFQLAYLRHSFIPTPRLDLSRWANRVGDAELHQLLALTPSCTELDLSGCEQLTDRGVAMAVERCPGLETVRLANCVRLTDTALSTIAHECGESLTSLDCTGLALLGDDGVRALARHCEGLRSLCLAGCPRVGNAALEALAQRCPLLSNFNISGCTAVTDAGANAIGAACSLHDIHVEGCCRITDSGLQALLSRSQRVRAVRTGDLEQLTDAGIRMLLEVKVMWGYKQNGGYPHMHTLDLSGCPLLTDVSLSWVAAGCKALRHLFLRRCGSLRDYGLRAVAMMDDLESLDITSCAELSDDCLFLLVNGGADLIDDESPNNASAPLSQDDDFEGSVLGASNTTLSRGASRCRLRSLRCFCAGGCPLLSDRGVSAAVEALPGLRTLGLGGLPRLTDSGLRSIAHACPELRELDLSHSEALTAGGVGVLPKFCRKLEHLDLHFGLGIGDDAIRSLSSMRKLKSLDIGLCRRLSDGAASFLPNWKLRRLSFLGVFNLGSDGARAIAEVCRELEALDVRRCELLDAEALRPFAVSPNCPKLSQLDVTGSPAAVKPDGVLDAIAGGHRASLHLEAVNVPEQHHADPPQHDFAPRGEVEEFGRYCGFVGVRRAKWGTNLIFQDEFSARLRLDERSALILQCFYRCHVARCVLRVLQHKHYLFKCECATEVNRIARGYLAKCVAYEELWNQRFIACRTQFLWRTYWMRKLKRRAVTWWGNRTLMAALISWRDTAVALRRSRKEKSARDSHDKAMKYWTHGMLYKVWAAWYKWAAKSAYARKRMPKAMAFWKNRTLKKCWWIWSAFALPQARRRRLLIKVFLNCIDLESRNTLDARSNRYIANEHYNKLLKRHHFYHWAEVMEAKAAMMRAAQASIRTKSFCWTYRPNDAHLPGVANDDAFRECAPKKYRKGIEDMAPIRWSSRVVYSPMGTLVRGLNGWRMGIVRQREAQESARKAIKFFQHATEARFLRGWSDVTRRKVAYRRKVERSLARIKLREVASCFNTWRADVDELKAFRGRALRRLKYRVEANCMDRWHRYCERERVLRYNQLHEFERLAKAASRVQARFRGMRGREFTEDRRIIAQFMCIKIQTQWRMRLARRVLWRRGRYGILREYVANENETELMSAEEEAGRELIRQYYAALKLQSHYRARHCRDVAYYARANRAKRRSQEEKERERVRLEEHYKKEQEREEQRMKAELSAEEIQRMVRGLIGRRLFRERWIKAFLDAKATRLQCAYRGKMGRRRAAGKNRVRVMDVDVKRQTRQSGALLRRMGLRNRRQQRGAMNHLAAYGVHPETFNIDLRKQMREVVADAKAWYRMAASFREQWARGKFDAEKRREIAIAFRQRLADESAIEMGDAVQIVAKGHERRGQTGCVLVVRDVPSVPGGRQAAVKMDTDGYLAFISVMTEPTKTEDSTHAMVKVAPHWVPNEHVTVETIANNKNRLLLRAEEMRLALLELRAARRLQCMYRGRKHRAFFHEEYIKQTALDEVRKERLLRILRRLRVDSARTGRILIRLGIVWPRYVPLMPERPIVPKWYTDLMERRRLDGLKDSELAELLKERYFRLQLMLKNGKLTKQDAPRWRRRSTVRLLFWTRYERFCRSFTSRWAERLELRALAHEGLAERALKLASRLVGGREWKRTPQERLVWAGKWRFEDLSDSPHVAAIGWGMYHGPWVNDQPHGLGYARFPKGDGYGGDEARRVARASDGGTYPIPEYDTIEGDFAWGKIQGSVTIKYKGGSLYCGPYISDGGIRRKGHTGLWTKADDTSYEGTTVDNHFNENDVTGEFHVVLPSGETYEGGMKHGLRHGKGTVHYTDGSEYEGYWEGGKREGHGRFMSASRRVYIGSWSADEKFGHGRQTFEDGSFYEGEYVESMFCGLGKLRNPNGDLYEGEFRDSEYHGYGEMVYADGSSYKGTWREGKRDTGDDDAIYVDVRGDLFHVPFHDDKMDGKGTLIAATGKGWSLEKYGLWVRGHLVRWLGVGTNPAATQEFVDHFKTYGDYNSMFAMIVSQGLPRMPPGVDPDDRRVEQHVAGILTGAGPLAGAKVIDQCELEELLLKPEVSKAKESLDAAEAELRDACEEEEDQQIMTEEQREQVDDFQEHVDDLTQQIADYWEADSMMTKMHYDDAVSVLNAADHMEWFACKQARNPPSIVKSLYTGICLLLGLEVKDKQFKMLMQNNKLNEDLGDKNALIREYDVKLLDEIDRWDVYNLAEKSTLVDRISVHVYNPNMKPDNLEIAQVSKVMSEMVTYLQAAFAYAKKAKDVVKLVRKRDKEQGTLNHERTVLREEEEYLEEKERETAEARKKCNAVQAQYDDIVHQLHEVQLTLERARSYAEIAKKGDPDNHDPDAPIIPWLSREDEKLQNAVKVVLDGIVDLVATTPFEVWDCVFTLKELTVSNAVMERNYGEGVPADVLDCILSMENDVAGGIEPEVTDAMSFILDSVAGGPEQEIVEILDGLVETVSRQRATELMDEARDVEYLGKNLMVRYSGTEQDYRGRATKAYVNRTAKQPDPKPGTGLIFIDFTTKVFGDGVSSRFDDELRVGDVLLIEQVGGAGLEGREIISVDGPAELTLSEAYSYYNVQNTWLKNWGYQRTVSIKDEGAIILEEEVCDVTFDDGEIELHVPLPRIRVLPTQEELDTKFLKKKCMAMYHGLVDSYPATIIGAHDDGTFDLEYDFDTEYGLRAEFASLA